MLHIEALTVQGVAGIDELHLAFQPGVNLITGPNGSGKTTILECIGHSFYAFAESSKVLHKNARQKRGTWSITARLGLRQETKNISVESFHPNEVTFLNEGFEDAAREALVFKSHRFLPYADVTSIARDPLDDMNRFTHEAAAGATLTDAKNWFVHRYLWSAHVGSLASAQVRNLARARECFGLLDPSVAFSRVMPETNDILVATPSGEIYFEYLSAGYQSCVSLLLGLIKEIEYRFKSPAIEVGEFEGVVLVDDIDLHLHPSLHVTIVGALHELLPKAQIIATTHSPHLIQQAGPGEVIALGFDRFGRVIQREIPNGPFGFQGWTVDEVLREVLGLKTTRTPEVLEVVAQFEKAIQTNDKAAAFAAYKTLDLMLHPQSPSREDLRAALTRVGERAS
jgi:predicted ATPase